MHDFMHNEVFHNRRIDQFFGMFFGTVCLGVNGHWWRDEHFEHHAFTNVYDEKTGYYDPQMREDVWMQNPILLTSFQRAALVFKMGQFCLIKIQHVMFVVLSVFFGRVGIVVDSMHLEQRWYEWVSFGLHWTWTLCLLSVLPSTSMRLIAYGFASLFEGVLHVQLLVSHYAKPWVEMESLATTKGWSRMQIENNMNIKNPIWLDWFHGGLNFHIEHHLYPTMPRHNFRAASVHVRKVCCDLGVEYDERPFFKAIFDTIANFRAVGANAKYEDFTKSD